jgi:hypothetical protein
MVVYVTVVIFLMALLMKKIARTIIPTYFSFIQMSIIATEHLCDDVSSLMIENWMESHFASDNNCNIVKSISAKYFLTKGRQIIGLHSLLVTLHEWFTISIEQDE